ncbi:hypothetical protein C8R48DRAFT_677795 [Suillus tomentosus]|nr:hypothetical protein C8R48DRAFT_677795 [Suillus tomentosus]
MSHLVLLAPLVPHVYLHAFQQADDINKWKMHQQSQMDMDRTWYGGLEVLNRPWKGMDNLQVVENGWSEKASAMQCKREQAAVDAARSEVERPVDRYVRQLMRSLEFRFGRFYVGGKKIHEIHQRRTWIGQDKDARWSHVKAVTVRYMRTSRGHWLIVEKMHAALVSVHAT